MKCTNCGMELAEDAKFCDACGTGIAAEETVVSENAAPEVETPCDTPVAETAETSEPIKEKAPSKIGLALAAFGAKMKALAQPVVDKCKPFVQKNKLWIAGGACLAILLITVLIIVSACNDGNGFTPFERAISAFVDDDEVMLQYENKKVIKTGIEAKSIEDEQVSIDGNVAAFLTSEKQLIVVQGKKAKVVADNVTEFILSVNGKGIGFVTRNEDGESTLKLLKVGKKNAKVVCKDFNDSTFALSPDGKSMAYFRQNDDKTELMYFSGSKSKRITSSEVRLVGLANKGKYIYVTAKNDDGDTTLFSYNARGNKRKIGSCVSLAFGFNEDHTQILFFDGSIGLSGFDGKTYVSKKGKEAVRISSGMATPLLPSGSIMHTSGSSATFPTEDLFNKVYEVQKDGQQNIWLLKKNMDKSQKLVGNAYGAMLDESGKYVYFLNKDQDLKMLKVSHGDRAADKAKLIAEEVENFVVTSNRKKVYFISDDALCSVNGKTGKGKKTIASEGVGNDLLLNQKDICYYTVEGDVYACSNGRRGKMVVAEYDDMYSSPNGIVYVETEDAIFATKTAKKPAKIFTRG